MKKLSGIIALLLNITLLSAQEKTVTYLYDRGGSPPDKVIDIIHLNAELAIDPYDTLVRGSVVFTFTPVLNQFDSVTFWAPDMDFDRVEIKGTEISYFKKGDNLVIRSKNPEEVADHSMRYELSMNYTSRPAYDLFFIGWNEPAERPNKQIWAHRPFHWLPYYSDRLSADMFITFDSNYKVFTNGVRESVTENQDGTNTWHYRMYKEHPFFSTCLVVGDYKSLEWKTADGLPLELCYYSWQEDHAEPTYRYTPQMFDFFKEEFGVPYPYEVYREMPVADYLYGAMETTTATVFGDYLAVDERAFDLRNYVNVNAHELAHQWYGNCLSHLKNSDVWLTESFATYYAKMFEKQVFGEDYYQNVRRLEFEEALAASGRDGFGVGHSRGGRARWYPKGSLVLDMMRDYLGEDGFKASIKHYTEKNLFSEVETGEFLAAVYEATGVSMQWFFEEWIYRGGEPGYQVSWSPDKRPDGGDETVIRVRQVHPMSELVGLFRMPVFFEVYYEDGTKDVMKQWIDEEYEEVALANPESKNVSFVLFDPGSRILKTISFDKSLKEWSAQALMAGEMIDRYDALVALRGYKLDVKEDILLKAYENETFHLTRGEIVKQLLEVYDTQFDELIVGALSDEDPLMRRAVLEGTDTIPDQLRGEYERLLHDQSYVNVEKALELLCRSFPANIPAYLEATKNETGWRGMNIRMKWLEMAIGAEQREYTMELAEYAGPRFEFETRINAFQLMKKLNYLDKRSAGYLVDGYFYWNYKVSNAALDVLRYFYQQNKGKKLIDEAVSSGPWTSELKEKVRRTLDSGY